ncbi:hypothetical protein ACJZ2D_015009 [Fusarium nematophilum]
MTVKTLHGESDKLSRSVNLVSRFLSLDQIYSTQELDAYLRELSVGEHAAHGSHPDVIVLCASAILSIAEAVFEWASQFNRASGAGRGDGGRVVLVLCGGIGPSTSFLYEAVKASAQYSDIFNDIRGKPGAQVLKAIAERFYGLIVGGGDRHNPRQLQTRENISILVEDRSPNFNGHASETRRVLENHGIYTPRSITVVPDPGTSRHTVAAFSRVYDKSPGLMISSWPALQPNTSINLGRHEYSPKSTRSTRQDDEKELWSMGRFLDLMLGEVPRGVGTGCKPRLNIPEEVEDAWSMVLDGCSFGTQDAYSPKLSL